jgi:hypothetical protein
MAITVKHNKVSTIPDDADTSLVRPSDWNDDHVLTGTVPVANGGTGAATLTGYVVGNGTAAMTASATIPSTAVTGLGTMSTQNANNVSITGGSISGTTVSGYIPTTEKAVANGVATLDGSGTVPISQLPAAVLGALSYQGTWNASTNTPTLTSSVGTKGYYYVVNVAGSTNLNGITDWVIGDWAVYNGSAWQKVDNTDAVTSVNGYTGTVVLTNTDISGFGTMSTQNANSVAITGGAIDGTTIGATTTSTGKFTTLNASTSLTTPIVQASNSGGLSLKNSAGTTQISMGGGGGDNVSINVATNINGTNAQIDISPTGTGHVHMKPTGTGSIEIAPTNVGTIDNMTIGATTPKAITGTTITATTFSGSGASLTSIPNSALVNSAITINGNSTALGGSVSVGTVTSVAATAGTGISITGSPITTSGTLNITNTAPDQTVVLTAGTGISTSGTYPNFTITNTSPSSGGTVTSVTGTAPVVSSGGNTPAISMAAANTTTNGYLTSTDWNTFNGKGSGTVTSVTATSPVTSTGGTTPVIAMPAATTSVNGYLTSTDWNTFNGKGSGTVTSVAALTLGTTGTDLSSTVATGTTTPVITLQVPTASATNRGALSSADWTTFNGKAPAVTFTTSYVPYGQGTTTLNQSSSFTYASSTLTAPIVSASNGLVVNSKTVSASYSIPSGSNASSVGPVTVASGQAVTVPSGSRWVVL